MEKIELQAGMLVKSLKGHDAGQHYIITAILNSDFVLVSDGERRTLENPKLKRNKHVKLLFANDKPIMISTKGLTDCKIKKFIKTC